MKKLLIVIGIVTMFNAYADIEYSVQDAAKPTEKEIANNRACFEDLKAQGCGDPGDDIAQFRSCMSNVYPSLTTSCKKMMSDLYGKK
jgi:hypothetical protein